MGEIRSFRDPRAYQAGRRLAAEADRWSRDLPGDERFGLAGQIRRCAVSIPLNITGGYGKGTTADFLRRLRDARGSASELQARMDLAADLHDAPGSATLNGRTGDTVRLPQALIRSLEEERREAQDRKPTPKPPP
ncbi:MAG: four helix bundle protein [Phycisphaerae bacterium]|nr:four helix bundle protein [Phycisphaerae bacterium]